MKKYGQFDLFLARLAGKACRKLHLTAPAVAHYQIDIDGSPVMTSKSNSWVRNMINVMACHGLLGVVISDSGSFFADGYMTLRRPNGNISSDNVLPAQDTMLVNVGTATTENGMRIGTSNTVESFDDYKLGADVPHGNSTGQMYHNAMTRLSKTWNSSERKWSLIYQRSFVNNSGSPIVINELGIYSRVRVAVYEYSNILLLRDVLPAAQTVNNGQTLTVTYTIEYQY